jgi:hypothetical protein
VASRPSASDLAWSAVIPAGLALVVALALIAPAVDGLYPSRDYPFFPEIEPIRVRPEPLESVRYLLAVIVPALLLAGTLAFGAARSQRRIPLGVVIASQAAVTVFVIWTVWKQGDVPANSIFGTFLSRLFPPRHLVAAPLIGVVLVLLAVNWDSPRLSRARSLGAAVSGRPWPAIALALVLTAFWLLPGVITDASISNSGLLPGGHIPIQYDEHLAASNGLTPLVDFVPFYSSLLPILFAPVFPLFDHSITAFSVVMTLLSLAALMAVYAAFRQVTQGAWTALALYVPFVVTAMRPWSTEGAVWNFNGSYFATMPERYLGPLLVLWLCARHLRRGSPPVWGLFLVAGLALLNNPEFGIGCVVALAVALLFGAGPDAWRRWLPERGVQAAAGLAGGLLLGCALILIRSGEPPNPELFAYGSRLAGRGFSLFPMSLWGFHWVLYLTYAAALLVAAVRHVKDEPDRTLTGMLAFAGTLGFLTGGIYAGRSLAPHLWSLFPVWGFALSLLAWSAWHTLRSAAGDRESLRRVAIGCFLALTGLGLMISGIDRFSPPWQQLDRMNASAKSPFDHPAEQSFIESRTDPDEAVLILGPSLEHRIAERAGVRNVSPWFGPIGLFGPNETERAIDQLEEADGTAAFLDIPAANFVSGEGITERVNAILRERGFRRVAADPLSGVVEWRLEQPG